MIGPRSITLLRMKMRQFKLVLYYYNAIKTIVYNDTSIAMHVVQVNYFHLWFVNNQSGVFLRNEMSM